MKKTLITAKLQHIHSRLLDFLTNEGKHVQGVQMTVYNPDANGDSEHNTEGSLTKYWFGGENGLAQWAVVKDLKKDDIVEISFSLRGQKLVPVQVTKADD